MPSTLTSYRPQAQQKNPALRLPFPRLGAMPRWRHWGVTGESRGIAEGHYLFLICGSGFAQINEETAFETRTWLK
jgi:hypothetical protein